MINWPIICQIKTFYGTFTFKWNRICWKFSTYFINFGRYNVNSQDDIINSTLMTYSWCISLSKSMWITGKRTWITWHVNYLTPMLTRWETWWVQKLVDLGLCWKLIIISDFWVKGVLFRPRKKLFVIFCQVIHSQTENIWLHVTQKL